MNEVGEHSLMGMMSGLMTLNGMKSKKIFDSSFLISVNSMRRNIHMIMVIR